MTVKIELVFKSILKTFVLFLLGLLLISCGEHGEESARKVDHLGLAEFYLAQGSIKLGASETMKHIKLMPEDPQGPVLLGRIFLIAEDGARAEKAFNNAIKRGMSPEELAWYRAQALELQGRSQDVLNIIESSENFPGVSPIEVRLVRARVLSQLGEFHEARRIADELIAEQVGIAEATLINAKISLAAGDIEAARQFANEVIDMKPESGEAWLLKGQVELLLEDLPSAEESFMKARELDEVDIITGQKLESLRGVMQAKIGLMKFDEAYEYYQRFLEFYPSSSLSKFEEGLQMVRNQDFDSAEQIFRNIMAQNPNHLPSAVVRGVLAYSNGNFEQASELLGLSVESNNASRKVVLLYAETQIRLGNPDAALEVLESVIADSEPDSELLRIYGLAAAGVGNHEAAEKAFQDAIKLDAENPLLLFNFGGFLFSIGDYESASDMLKKSLDLDRELENVYALLVASELKAGKLEDAKRIAFEFHGQSISGSEGASGKLYDFFRILAGVGFSEWVVDHFEKLPGQYDPTGERFLLLSEFHLAAGDSQRALEFADRSIALAGESAGPLAAKANVLLKSGKAIESIDLFEKALTIDAKNSNALIGISRAYAVTGDLKKAAEFAQRALELSKNSSAPAMGLLAAVAMKAGNYGEARRLGELLALKHGKSDSSHVIFGDLHARVRDWAKAVEEYRTALKLNSSSDNTMRLARALALDGQVKQSTMLLEKWLQDNPRDYRARLLLAQWYLENAKNASALEHFEYLNDELDDNALVLNNLAWLYGEIGDSRAEAAARRAVKLNPENALIIDTLGWILVSSGKPHEGLAELKRAAALEPENAVIKEHLEMAIKKVSGQD